MALPAEINAIARSNSLAASLERAYGMAVDQAHRVVTLEHLLFALTDDAEAAVVLAASSIDLNRLRADVSSYLGNLHDDGRQGPPSDPVPDADLLRILKAAAEAAQQSRRRQIDGAIVLAALVGDGKSSAAGLLRAHGLTFETAIRALQQVSAAANAASARAQPAQAAAPSPAQVSAQASANRTAPPARVLEPEPAANPTDDLLASVRARLKKTADQAPAIELPPRPARKAEPAADPRSAPAWDGIAPANDMPEPGESPAKALERAAISPRTPPPLPTYAGDAYTSAEPAMAGMAASQAHSGPPPQPLHPGWTPPSPQRQMPAQWQQAAPVPAAHGGAAVAAQMPQQSPSLADRMLRAGDGPPRPPLPSGGDAMAFNGLGAPSMPHYPSQPPHPPMARPNGHAPANRAMAQPTLDPFARGQPRPREPQSFVPNVAAPIEIGPIDGLLPRRLRQLRARGVEIRLPRASLTEVGVAVPGPDMPLRADFGLSRAVTLRLASGGRTLAVEVRSPETLWILPGSGTPQDDLAWRWELTGLRPGRAKVRLSGSVRTIATNGTSSEAALFEQLVEVRVTARKGRRIAILVVLLLALGLGAAAGLTAESRLLPLFEQARQLLGK